MPVSFRETLPLIMTKKCLAISFILWALSLGLLSCKSKTQTEQQHPNCAKEASLPVNYAQGFSVDYYNGFKVITVKDWRDPLKVLAQYVLLPKGKPGPVDFPNAILLDTPVRKVICISTNHISALARLGLVDSIAGVANVALIYNKQVQEVVMQNKIADIGKDELNYEKIVELNPSFVFTSGNWDGGDKVKQKLNSLRIKSVLNLDYMEQEPLARAEWLKFVAAFYDKEFEADSIFKEIEQNYLALKEKAKNISSKPTVFANLPFKEIWYMPCGDNYMAKLIADAGGDFLWKDAKATNGLNLNLDYEAVYAKAADADIWLCNGFASSLEEIKAADKKNAFFKAYKSGNVFNNDKRNTPSGGFDFWESGAVTPDKVLADLIFIFHPELLPKHELYYYRRLK
jgi:iron complex transport system substrate-binding protein